MRLFFGYADENEVFSALCRMIFAEDEAVPEEGQAEGIFLNRPEGEDCFRLRKGKREGCDTSRLAFLDVLAENSIDVSGKKVFLSSLNNSAEKALEESGAVFSGTWEDCEVIVSTGKDLYTESNAGILIDLDTHVLRSRAVYEAQRAGVKTVRGIEFLVRKMLQAYAFLHGKENVRITAEDCLRQVNTAYRNIVLTGMPTSGKTTFAALVSEKTGREMVEVDDEIIKAEGMAITEIFSRYGEEHFRKTESRITAEISSGYGKVISCGGGVVKNEENMVHLASNGLILWLDRKPELLYGSASRPLAASDDMVRKLYTERKPLYQKYADVRIENNGTIDACLDAILSLAGGV